jgi:hypothetical protein
MESAFELAVTRVCEIHSCHDLFMRIGADGVKVLTTAIYYPANPGMENRVCRRATLLTGYNFVPVWVCRRFGTYSDERATIALIHEALHNAGLVECPPYRYDRRCFSSADIDVIVSRACAL